MNRNEKVRRIIDTGFILIHPCNLGEDDGSIYWLDDDEINMIYDDIFSGHPERI